MIKIAPEKVIGRVNGRPINIESKLSLESFKESKYKVTIDLCAEEFPFNYIPAKFIFTDVVTANPDELREFHLKELPGLVEQYVNQIYKIVAELKECKTDYVYAEVFEVGINKFMYDAIEKIVTVKDNPEYTKERIISYLEKVLVVTYDSVNHPTRDEELAHWKNQCENLRKELAKYVPGGVK